MTTAAAIVLFLNGVQVFLPRPALFLEGRACVPLRPVCERVGATVTAQDQEKRVVVNTPGGPREFQLRSALGSDPNAAVLVQGTVYVAAKDLAHALGGQCAWNARTRAVTLQLPWAGPTVKASVQDLSRDPLRWRETAVEMAGRYGGRLWSPLDPPGETRPPSDDAFLLLGPETMLCAGQEWGLGLPNPPPLSCLGRSVSVSGKVSLTESGTAFLKVGRWQFVSHERGPELYLSADRLEVAPGQTCLLELTVGSAAAPTAVRMAPRSPGAAPELTLRAPDGGVTTLTLDEVATVAVGGTVTWFVPWVATPGQGREGSGVWRCTATRPSSGPPAQCRFRVSTPAHGEPASAAP